MGGGIGGQADYVMVPYADFTLLKFPDKAQAMAKIRDLTCLSDILPTGYHGCITAGLTTGSAYKDFDKGAAKKFVIDPHGSLTKTA